MPSIALRAPPKIQSTFARYKECETHITQWLVQTAKAHNVAIAGSHPKYDLLLKEYLSLAQELILRQIQPPSLYKTYLDDVIRLRTRCSKWYTANMPDEISDNDGHLWCISVMRQLRKLLFKTPLDYNTPDSDYEPATDLVGYRDCSDDEDSGGESSETSEEELSEDDSEELENALWTHFEELELYRTYLDEMWGKRARTGSPSLLVMHLLHKLVLQLAGILQTEFEELYPSMEDADYTTILRAFGHNHQRLSGIAPWEQSLLMTETWVASRAFFSMTEDASRGWAARTLPVKNVQNRDKEAGDHLLRCLCMKRRRDVSADRERWWEDVAIITTGKIFEHQTRADAIWWQGNTKPLRHLQKLVRQVTASIENWLDVHDPQKYDKELVQKARNVITYAAALFDDKNQTAIYRSDPLARGRAEYILLKKSWAVGQQLIGNASRHQYLPPVISLYLHLRAHSDMPAIPQLEHLRKFLIPCKGRPDDLRFRDEPASVTTTFLSALADRDLPSVLKRTAELQRSRIAILTLDAFSIEQMAFNVLEELDHFFRRRHVDVECFIRMWNSKHATPEKLTIIASIGRLALERGLASVALINPHLTFITGPCPL